MKLKNRKQEINEGYREEFFRLPRVEQLVDGLQKHSSGQIGDLVTNPSWQMANRFTLQAGDNQMQGADIQQGDYLIVEKKSNYHEGCILVVKLGNRQLVRRYFRAEGRIHLKCDPPAKQIIIVDEHTPDFHILGQVVQIVREIK
jgi:SOS-response transcriptional repressor LexA